MAPYTNAPDSYKKKVVFIKFFEILISDVFIIMKIRLEGSLLWIHVQKNLQKYKDGNQVTSFVHWQNEI